MDNTVVATLVLGAVLLIIAGVILSSARDRVPLAVITRYLLPHDAAGVPKRIAMASGLVALTLAMEVGIVAAILGFCLPAIRGGYFMAL
jgi:hypothetical protein